MMMRLFVTLLAVYFASAAKLRGPAVNGVPADPLSLGALPPGMGGDLEASNTLPPFGLLNSGMTTSPPLVNIQTTTVSLEIDQRIKQAEDLLNRMVWQLNRETSWANSVHDIIQNYQYKYTKVLSNIKKHSASTKKMRDLVSTLKKARVHEILVSDLHRASDELEELAATSKKTGSDEGSYAALKERAALIRHDLEKMSKDKVNKVLHDVQTQMKAAADEAVPPASSDTLKDLSIEKAK